MEFLNFTFIVILALWGIFLIERALRHEHEIKDLTYKIKDLIYRIREGKLR